MDPGLCLWTGPNTKCSLFRLQRPGTKIASYIILNESPLSGPGVDTDLSACFLGGRKDMQSKEQLHQGKERQERRHTGRDGNKNRHNNNNNRLFQVG